MKCPKCGMSLPDDSVFCQYCGCAISREQIAPKEDLEQESKKDGNENEKTSIKAELNVDYQQAVSSYNRLSAEQKERFFPGKESQAKKVLGSLVYLLGEEVDSDSLYEVYLTIASRLQLGFTDDRVQSTIKMKYSSLISNDSAPRLIECIRKLSSNFSHLQKDKRQEALSIDLLFDSQFRQRFAVNETKIEDAIRVPDFGTSPENPVYAHGVSSSYDYLNTLYSIDSIPLFWDRIGSTSTDTSDDLIDAYELCLPDGTHYNTVYINMYSKATSAYCPRGMSSFELMQIPSINDPITKASDGRTDEPVSSVVPHPEGMFLDQHQMDNVNEPKVTAEQGAMDATKATETDQSTAEDTTTTSNSNTDDTVTQPINLISVSQNKSTTQSENKHALASNTQETSSTGDVIQCKKCGRTLPSDSEFCQYCGSRDLIVSEINRRREKSEIAIRSEYQDTAKKPNPPYDETHDNCVTNPKTESNVEHNTQKNTPESDTKEIKRDSAVMDSHSVPASSNERVNHKQEKKNTENDKSEQRQETSGQSVNNAFYCKRCGGSVDKISRKCSGCGKQYFRLKAILPALLISLVGLLLVGLNILQYLNNRTNELHRGELEQSIAEKDARLLEVEQTIANKDTYISELEQTIKDRDGTISSLNSTIASQETKIANLNKQVEDLQDDYFDAVMENLQQLSKLSFYEDYAVVVPDDGTNLYHTYGCDYLDTSYFWIYNIEAAIGKGFKPCSHCQNKS